MSWRAEVELPKQRDVHDAIAEVLKLSNVFTVMNRTYKVENYGTEPVIHLFSRDLKGKRVHHKVYGFPPYFYGGMENLSELMWKTEASQPIIQDILGRDVKKVELRLPRETVKARKEFDYHCGANILFEDRWYWDSKIKVTYTYEDGIFTPVEPKNVPIVKRRIDYFDIETLGPKEFFADETIKGVPVIMIQCLDNYTLETYVFYIESPHWTDTVPSNVTWRGMDLPTGVRWPYDIHFVKVGTGVLEYDEYKKTDWKSLTEEERERIETLLDNERVLLRAFTDRVAIWDPDDYTGWNINNYDWQKLNSRARELGVQEAFRRVSPVNWYTIRGKRDDDTKWSQKGSVKINGRTSMDMLELYKQQTKPDGEEPGYSLKEVLARRIGLAYDELGPYMSEVWQDPNGREKLFKYGALDVIGPYLLNEGSSDLHGTSKSGEKYRAMHMWHQPEVVRRLSGCSLSDTLKKIRMLHPLLWRHIPDRPIPTTVYGREDEGEKVGGGEVFPPTVGMHEWTGVIDFTGMYPNIIDSYNMGWETLLTEEQVKELDDSEFITVKYDYFGVERTIYFDNRYDSSLRILCRYLIGLREEYRAKGKTLFKAFNEGTGTYEDWYFNFLFEINAKFMANSIYGVNNYSGWPMYCPPVANAITGVGRDRIKFIAKRIEEEFPWIKVVYGDTDSVFLKVEAKTYDEAVARFTLATARANEILVETSSELGLEKPLEVKLEKIYNPIVFKGEYTIYKSGKVKFKRGTKKRYFGQEVYKDGERRDPPKIVFVGLEVARSDAAPFVQKLQEKAGRLLLQKKDTAAYVRYIRKWYKQIRKIPINELAAPKGLGKHPKDYIIPNAWTKACLYAMSEFDQAWMQTIKPAIVYIKHKKKGKYPTEVPGLVNKQGEPYPIETVTSLTGDLNDIPEDFWDEWEIDYEKMREKVFKNKFADLCLSIGEDWSYVEGFTTLDRYFKR